MSPEDKNLMEMQVKPLEDGVKNPATLAKVKGDPKAISEVEGLIKWWKEGSGKTDPDYAPYIKRTEAVLSVLKGKKVSMVDNTPATTTSNLTIGERIKQAPKNKKIVAGYAGAAGVAALVLGAPVLIPAALLGGGAYYLFSKPKSGKMTPEREAVYNAALNAKPPLSPEKLRDLASAFENEGLAEQADMLRKRAGLREAPKEVKKARREVFKKALRSDNPEAVKNVANAFKGAGATGMASQLDEHAKALKMAGR